MNARNHLGSFVRTPLLLSPRKKVITQGKSNRFWWPSAYYVLVDTGPSACNRRENLRGRLTLHFLQLLTQEHLRELVGLHLEPHIDRKAVCFCSALSTRTHKELSSGGIAWLLNRDFVLGHLDSAGRAALVGRRGRLLVPGCSTPK